MKHTKSDVKKYIDEMPRTHFIRGGTFKTNADYWQEVHFFEQCGDASRNEFISRAHREATSETTLKSIADIAILYAWDDRKAK